MPQLMMCFAMLYLPTRPPMMVTVLTMTLSQPGMHYPTLQPIWTSCSCACNVGNLFAIGGNEISTGRVTKKEVYIYSTSTNSWIYTSDLPAPRVDTAIAELSTSELMVISGKVAEYTRVSAIYTGTLTLYN